MKVPDPEDLSKIVEIYEKRYGKLEHIYRDVLRKFGTIKLCNLSEDNIECILNPYFLKWGKMGRVLGFKGVRRIGDRLKEMDAQLSKFQQEDLITLNLDIMSSKIANIYDDIMNTEWLSKKGKMKRVGPTSASKALHLVAPNLFIIWDRAIRNYYGFKDNGEGYIRFLANMQDWIRKLKPTIERLQKRYKKSCTKIIDEYNWMVAHSIKE